MTQLGPYHIFGLAILSEKISPNLFAEFLDTLLGNEEKQAEDGGRIETSKLVSESSV